LRDNVKAVGKFGWDDEEGSGCGVGGYAEPVVEEGEKTAGVG
jgi:hypothetical protein